MEFKILLLEILTASFYYGAKATFTNFKVNTYVVCNNTQLQVNYYGHVTKEKDNQYLTHNLTLPFAVGDNIGMEFLIEAKAVGNTFVELFTIREKNFCKGFNKYLGEFWYDIERYSQISVGVCPLRQGTYHGNRILLHFEKISLQTFPFGTLRFTVKAIDNSNKNTVLCIFLEVDNIVN